MKRIVFLILLVLPMWAGAQATPPPPHGSILLPPGSGKPIVQRACAKCHALGVVTAERGTAAHWTQVVNQMVSRGMALSDPEIDTIVKYLASNFGPIVPETNSDNPSSSSGGIAASTGRVNVNTASAERLQSSLGLNQKEAEAVIEYRKKNGPFKTWQDVAEVPEVSPNQIEALQDRLAF